MSRSSSTAVAPAPPEDKPAPLPPNKKLMIDPNACMSDWSGQARASVFCKLPEGFVADDLKRSELWFRVQQSPRKALRTWDAVFLVAFDQSWAAEAFCSEADNEGVTLAGIKIVPTPPRRQRQLYRDATYSVEWSGRGFYVAKVANGQRVTQDVHTPELAERDVRNLYPQRPGF